MTAFRPSGQTQVFGIFGHPVRHSLSPKMQQAAFEALNLPHIYLPFEVMPDQLGQAAAAIRALDLQGINITIPHKENVIPYLDEIDAEARKIGAVNTIQNKGGRLTGFNTDGRGFVASLEEAGLQPANHIVLLLGAGGAAKGVAVALLDAGVSKMHILARRPLAAENLAKRLKSIFPQRTITAAASRSEKTTTLQTEKSVLLINSTPLGMSPEDALPYPASQIKPEWVVADLIYRPYETPLLIAAKKLGATTIPGLGMLLHQGALSFKIWTGLNPPIDRMRHVLRHAFSENKKP